MKTKVIHLHMSKQEDYHKPTAAFIRTIDRNHFEVIDGITDKGISEALKPHWAKSDLIKIDQDSVPTYDMLLELETCKHPICVNPTISYPKSTDLDRPKLNQIRNGYMYEYYERPDFVTLAGTGVCKISKAAQLKIKLSEWFNFPRFDSELAKWYGLAHCHYPLHKHHKK